MSPVPQPTHARFNLRTLEREEPEIIHGSRDFLRHNMHILKRPGGLNQRRCRQNVRFRQPSFAERAYNTVCVSRQDSSDNARDEMDDVRVSVCRGETELRIATSRRELVTLALALLLCWQTCTCFAASDSSWAGMTDLAVSRTLCEYAKDPLGIDVRQPRLTWILVSDRRGVMQRSYQILVASSLELLAENTGDLWDSGPLESEESSAIYEGHRLVSRQRCFWKVRVQDEQKHFSSWSAPAMFEMGLLEPADWNGQWIGLSGENTVAVSPLLRKEFTVGGPVKAARLYAAGLGWAEYSLNGQRIGDHVLDAAATDYDKRMLYVTHDVTHQLHPGVNAVGASLGNGWYCQPDGAGYGTSPQLKMELVVELADGTLQHISSDDTWKSSTGPVVTNSIWDGEFYDARQEKPGWTHPNYDDADWLPAAVKASPGGRLEAQMLEPIEARSVQAVKLTNPVPGVYVYDFGQLFGGWARLRVKGPEGTMVALRYSARVFPEAGADSVQRLNETIERDVQAGHASPTLAIPGLVDKRRHRSPDGATDFYVLSGDPDGELYEPSFTFHPVRYIQVENFPGTPSLSDLEACVVHSDVDMSGSFECSNPLLNQIHRNCMWTFTNQMYGFPMDCLYREYWGWLEPGTNPATFFSRRFIPRFWTKFLRDVQYAQYSNGVIPDVIPNYPPKGRTTGDPAWAGNYPLIVWSAYQTYGDLRLLQQHYPNMARWVAYLESLSEGHLIKKGGYYGDHMLPGDSPGNEEFVSKETPQELVWSEFYFNNIWVMSQVARILDKSDDTKRYGEQADDIKAAINARWLHSSGKHYATSSQTANISALAFGLVPEANRQEVLKSLKTDILQKRSGHLHTGNFGTSCVMDALPALGAGDVLFGVVTKTAYPGWGYMVDRGATTIWEAWGGVQHGFTGYNSGEDSMPMFATITEYFYNDLAGIRGPDYFGTRTVPPGFREVHLRPDLKNDLTGVKAHVRTVKGIVGVEWQRDDGIVRMKATIPANAVGRISVPTAGLKEISVREGSHDVWKDGHYIGGAPGISSGTSESDYMTFQTGSGTYLFTLTGTP